MNVATRANGIGQLTDHQLLKVATGGNVFIVGATGTGKSNLARVLYQRARSLGHVFTGPAVYLDCLDEEGCDEILETAADSVRSGALVVVDHLLSSRYNEKVLEVLASAEGGCGQLVLTDHFGGDPGQEKKVIELCSAVVFMNPFGRPIPPNRLLGRIIGSGRKVFESFGLLEAAWQASGPQRYGWMLAVTQDGFFYGRAPAAA